MKHKIFWKIFDIISVIWCIVVCVLFVLKLKQQNEEVNFVPYEAIVVMKSVETIETIEDGVIVPVQQYCVTFYLIEGESNHYRKHCTSTPSGMYSDYRYLERFTYWKAEDAE